jgi:hypothetical protein
MVQLQIWLRRIHFSLSQQKDVEYIKSVVNRALLSLPQSKRIKFLSQTAILEFKCGVPEEGRSRFELILREYPKRTDLWSVYLDQVILHLQSIAFICHYVNLFSFILTVTIFFRRFELVTQRLYGRYLIG